MKALTIWQPWASLIMAGAKPFEFRRWDYRSRNVDLVDRRIVIHAGARPVRRAELSDLLLRIERDGGRGTGLKADLAFDLLDRWWRQGCGKTLPLASGLGSAILGCPRKASALFAGTDSDRIDEHIYAWPLTDIERFEPPVPARGAQGFWRWQPEPGDG